MHCAENNVEAFQIQYPTKERFIIRDNSELTVMFDSRTRNPRWAIETLSSRNKGADRKKSKFYMEESIDESFRVSPNVFTGSGYSRGHLAPAADFSHTQEAMDATFTMANISPQSSELNKGYWSHFESWVRRLLNSYEEVTVITGPAFVPVHVNGTWLHVHRTIGTFPNLVEVPTHFFKVILARGKKGSARKDVRAMSPDGSFNPSSKEEAVAIGAFIVPNEPVDPKSSLLGFRISVTDLECLVGLRFFDQLITVKQRRYLDSRSPVLSSSAIWLRFLDGTNESTQSLPIKPTTALTQSSPSANPTESVAIKSRAAGSGAVTGQTTGVVRVCHLCDDILCNFGVSQK